MFSREFIDRIKSCGVHALAMQCTQLKDNGHGVFTGRCPNPGHKDKHSSFWVKPNQEGIEEWCCFGCHTGPKGGTNFGTDNIAFVQWITWTRNHVKLSFPEAVKEVADFYHIPMEKTEDRYSMVYQKNRDLCIRYEKQMIPFVQNYLYERGLEDKDISAWHIGYDGDRITFPLFGRNKKILGFSNRAFSTRSLNSGIKYKNSPNSPVFHKGEFLYGIDKADVSMKDIWITEGQFDVILGMKYGMKNLVGAMTAHLSVSHVQWIIRNHLQPVLCFDRDEAGEKGMMASLEALSKAGAENCRMVLLPEGKDLADTAMQVKEGLPQFIKEHTFSYSQYLLKGIADHFDSVLMEERGRAVPKIRHILSRLNNKSENLAAKDYITRRMKLWDLSV